MSENMGICAYKAVEKILDKSIKQLVRYGVKSGLIPEREQCYSTNLLLDIFKKMDYSDPELEPEQSYPAISLQEILDELCDIACSLKLIEDSITYRDLFDTRLMNCILPRPAQVTDTFWEKYRKSPREATDLIISEGPESHCGSSKNGIVRLSEMSALRGKRRICGKCDASCKTEP